MTSKKVFQKDGRENHIIELILNYSKFDFSSRGTISEKGDETDAIILGLNTLGEELSAIDIIDVNYQNRITEILNSLQQLALSDYSCRVPISDKGDTIDAIGAGLNMIAEELEASGKKITNFESRIDEILETLLNYTMMDFSKKLEIGAYDDELDAISLGLNTLSEELQHAIATEKKRTEESKEANKALILATNNLSGIINGTTDKIIALDTDYKIIAFNAAYKDEFYKIFGKKVYIGLTMMEALADVPPQDKKNALDFFARGLAGEDYTIIQEFGKEELSRNFYELNFYPIKDDNYNIIGVAHMARDITERKRAENELIKLSSIVESSHDAILSKNLEDIILSWNKGAERVFGYTSEEIIGKHISILIPSDRQHEETEIMDKIKRGEYIGHYETLRKRKNGQLIDVSLTISPVKDAEGKIIGASKILRDITEHKLAEEKQAQLLIELQKSSEQVTRKNWVLSGISEINNTIQGEKELLALTRDIINKLATYLNAQVGAIYLIEREYVLKFTAGYAFKKINKDSDTINFGEGLVGQAALEKKSILFTQVPDNYLKINSGLGNVIPKNILVTPFVYEGRVKGVIELGSVLEFTELQIEYLNLVIESIAVAINSSQAREQTKKLLEQTQHQAHELEAQQEELRQTNEELLEQSQLLQASEEELKVQQEELLQTNAELKINAQLLEEKNDAIEQARQAVALKAEEIEANSKYKSEFLTNMSHELRTPLNSVLILAKLLADNKNNNLDEKQIEYARVICKSGNDLLTLINDILDLSKIEARKMDLEFEEAKISDIASDIKSLFTELAAEKKIGFKINIDKNTAPAIKTDKARLEQIIKNLLSNAFKFTPKGGTVELNITQDAGNIRFNNENLYKAKSIIAFSVSDTGIGIPKEKQKLIFEAFKQADGSTSRKYGGTGLGLSISRELVNVLGGEIQIKSEEGKGSTFTVYLPSEAVEKNKPGNRKDQLVFEKENIEKEQKHLKPALPHEDEYLANEISDDRNNISTSDKVILIIEDDVNFAKILLDYTHEKGYKGIIAVQGDKGLSYARKYKPHGIILDMQLPVLDGWSILKILKDDPELKTTPVHIISAMDREKLGLGMGAVTYLKKPVDKNLLDKTFNDIAKTLSGGIKKVLIVEDNIIQNEAIVQLIKDNEKNVLCIPATSAEEAHEKLQKEKFDCIILDLGLQDMSGFEFLEKLRKNKEYLNIPVIIYTGKDLTKEEEKKLKKYASTIVIKSARSYERLLDETSLFLHKIENADSGPSIRRKVLSGKMEELLRNKTVLLTDDDMRNVFALITVLEEQGLKVISASDGKEALQKLKGHPEIDIVLMDMMMPEMDGYEAMREIRKQSKYKNLPILAITAKAMKGDREECLNAGASDYISKPINTDQLLSLMRVWLYK